MLTHRVIPCLDVNQGRVVKGVNFVDLRDAGDPVEIARQYDEAGADELVFLDITASHESRDITYDMVRRVAEQHGGTASASNRAGGGAAVSFTIAHAGPAATADAAPAWGPPVATTAD